MQETTLPLKASKKEGEEDYLTSVAHTIITMHYAYITSTVKA